jgi:hypothetical protein
MTRLLATACALVLLALPARAAEVNGYAAGRSFLQNPQPRGLLPTDDVPIFLQLFEVNGQLKQTYAERGFLYGDVSMLTQVTSGFRGLNDEGEAAYLPDHDVKSLHPLASLNELYVSHDVRPELNLLLGKKRITWGTGFSFNPTDVLNPPKDPTDPNFQRAGVYMARVEVPLEKYAFTFVAAPAVIKQEAGIPFQFLTWPTWDPKDDQYHYQLAARAYALVENADLNLMLFYGNKFNDAFQKKPRLGASFSRYFFTDYELHAEALLQTGSTRDYVNHDCVEDQAAAISCFVGQQKYIEKYLLDSPYLYPKVLLGTRYQFSDEAILSVEYFFQSDGYTARQYQDFISGLDLLRSAREFGFNTRSIGAGSLLGGDSSDGVPQKFVFQPVARHYLIAAYSKPRIRDDFTVGATLIANLQDLSSMLSPQVTWSVRDWVSVSLSGFFPIRGLDSLGAKTADGAAVTEYGSMSIDWRALLDVRVFY